MVNVAAFFFLLIALFAQLANYFGSNLDKVAFLVKFGNHRVLVLVAAVVLEVVGLYGFSDGIAPSEQSHN